MVGEEGPGGRPGGPPERHIIATVSTPPSSEIVYAFESGFVEITRRLKVYEADGKTLWNPIAGDFTRLVDGTINVDQGSDERRKGDFLLDNIDQKLRPDPNGGFWYDKILKPYRGIRFIGGMSAPRVAIIDSYDTASGIRLKQFFATMGFDDVDIITWATSLEELAGYGMIVSYTRSDAPTKEALLDAAWRNGASVLTIGTGSSSTEFASHYATDEIIASPITWGIRPAPGDSPASGKFAIESTADTPGRVPRTLAAGAVSLALWDYDAMDSYGAAMATSAVGSHWTDIHLPYFEGPETKKLIRAMVSFMRGVGQDILWETQMGEFMIDGISLSNFPDQVSVTCRDYTKKLMQSKTKNNIIFEVGTSVRDLIRSLAINSGIDPLRIRLAVGNEQLTSEMSYKTGTPRWQIIKEVCESFNYEAFFNAFGDFIVNPYADPTTSPISMTFGTGPRGNLIKFDKSVADSDIFNHVIVTATPTDTSTAVMPFFGEAENTDPTSPTNTTRLGDRVLPIEANYLSSDLECQNLAESRMKITALEAYNVNTDSLYYPWLEVGVIVEVLDPDALAHEPTRYLLTSLTFPMGLAAMSGASKRITFVGSAGQP